MTRYDDLAGRRVFITGGASGIGAEVVRAFAAQDADVTFFDINSDAGDALATSLGETVRFRLLDLTDPDQISATFAAAIKDAGGVDILVNGAANDTRHKTDDVTPEIWRAALAVNLDHQFFCSRAVSDTMRQQGHGVILNFGSIAWRVGLADAAPYVTAKAGIEGLTRALALELGADGIRVNCLLPGFVRTERQVEKWLTPELERTVLDNQCLNKFIEPEEIASVALFLCSEASSAVTNQTIVVDAGWS